MAIIGGLVGNLISGLTSGLNPIEQRQGTYSTGGQIQLYPSSWIPQASAQTTTTPLTQSTGVTSQQAAEQQAFQNYINSLNANTGGTTNVPAPVQAPSSGGDIISRIGRGDFVGQERADASGMYRWNGNGWDWIGSHQERLGAQIESAYEPTMKYLTEAKTGFETASAAEQKRLEDQYNIYAARLPTEKAGLESGLAESQRKTFETQQSAYDQATRAYNALAQQAGAKYGMASSAGGAVGELARREYARQQGQIGQQGVSAQTEFARQAETIRTYIAQKTDDLKIQRDDAIAKLNSDLQDRLLQIAGLRTQTEQAKTQLKLQVVQDAINQAREIENYDKTLRAGLASFGLQQLAEVSGRTLSPTEIQSYATQFGILPATTTGTTQPLSLLQTGVGGLPGKTTEDILAQGTAAF